MHKQFIIAPSPDANGQGAFGRPMFMGDRSIKKEGKSSRELTLC